MQFRLHANKTEYEIDVVYYADATPPLLVLVNGEPLRKHCPAYVLERIAAVAMAQDVPLEHIPRAALQAYIAGGRKDRMRIRAFLQSRDADRVVRAVGSGVSDLGLRPLD